MGWFEMSNGGWISDNGDPDNFLFELVGREDNNMGYENPEATRLMRAARIGLTLLIGVLVIGAYWYLYSTIGSIF